MNRYCRSVVPLPLALALVAGWASSFLQTSAEEVLAEETQDTTSGPEAAWPKVVHLAFNNCDGYLDGPAREALAPVGKPCSVDEDGNVFFVSAEADGSIRVILKEGLCRTVAGDNRWQGSLDVEEGPAAFIPHLQRQGGIGNPVTTIVAVGRPLQILPNGQPGGYLLTRGGHGTGKDNWIYKVWRNPDKGGRWWFKVVMGNGKTAPPTEVGQSVPAKEVRFRQLPLLFRTQRLPEGRMEVYAFSEGAIWRYDDAAGTLTCVLSPKDYLGKPELGLTGDGKPPGNPDRALVGPDGSFYLAWYQGSYSKPFVARVYPDRQKVERIAQNSGSVDKMFDGDALSQAAFFGGPLLAGGGIWPPDIVFFGAVDDSALRRLKDGRVSTLCKDGEWREFPRKGLAYHSNHPYTHRECAPDRAPRWGRGWSLVPWKKGDQTGYYVVFYTGEGEQRFWLVGPVDFGKPTVGPRVGGN